MLAVSQTNFPDDISAKSAGKMADFETLTLCISLNSSQMCTYFCKDLGHVYTMRIYSGKLQKRTNIYRITFIRLDAIRRNNIRLG